jgi:hypothetical protein
MGHPAFVNGEVSGVPFRRAATLESFEGFIALEVFFSRAAF